MRSLSIAITIAASMVLTGAPVQAQDFLSGILRGAAQTVTTRMVDRAVDGAVNSVTRPAPAGAPAQAPAQAQPRTQASPPPREPGTGGRNQPASEATRLSYMEARGRMPPTGWYVLRPELTREQNCQAMRAAQQWTQARSENPCRPR